MAGAPNLSQQRVDFLNATTPAEAKAFYDWLVEFKNCYDSTNAVFPQFSGDDQRQPRNRAIAQLKLLKGLRQDARTMPPGAIGAVLTHPGKHWLAWATCKMVQSQAAQTFNRQQLDVAYTKKPAIVRQALWTALFQGVTERRSGTASTRTQPFMAHHIGWAVNKEGGPLTNRTGRGASVSHRCDAGECIQPSHLVFTAHHRDNMARQRCPGLVLVVKDGVIIEEKPCIHDAQPTDPEHLDTCRHITMVEVVNPAIGITVAAGWVTYP